MTFSLNYREVQEIVILETKAGFEHHDPIDLKGKEFLWVVVWPFFSWFGASHNLTAPSPLGQNWYVYV